MATSAHSTSLTTGSKLNVLRVAAAVSLTAVTFILLCWIGARLGLGPATHMYIQLFSGADVASVAALLTGLCWSLAGGAIAGGLFAFLYNLLAGIEAR